MEASGGDIFQQKKAGVGLFIRDVVDSVGPRDVAYLSGVYSVDAAKIDAAFCWVGAPLMMGIDSAGLAKIVFGGVRAPAVECQVFRALQDFYAGRDGRDGGGAATRAERTITTAGRG